MIKKALFVLTLMIIFIVYLIVKVLGVFLQAIFQALTCLYPAFKTFCIVYDDMTDPESAAINPSNR